MKADMDFRFDDSLLRPAALKADDLRKQLVANVSGDLSRQLDDEVRAALDRLTPGWTLEDIKDRLRWQTYAQQPGVETLLLDGEPVLELQPPHTDMAYDKGHDSYTVTFSRDVKRFR